MKILHVIPSADPKQGGPIQGIRNYEAALKNLSVKRSLICFETEEDIMEWDFPSTIEVIGLGKSTSIWQYSKVLIPWLRLHISTYDKVILNGMWTYHTYATLRVISQLKKERPELILPEIFLMPHGMLDPWFQQAKTRRLKAIRNYIYWELIEKHVVNNVKGLLFTCEEELLLSRKTFRGYNPKSELNIGYGISAPPVFVSHLVNYFYSHFGFPSSMPYFLFLSRIDPKKGVDLLLEAYAELLMNIDGRTLPDLVIAGHGLDTRYGRSLLKLMEHFPCLKTKVRFVGQLAGELKWGAIYGCEVFILPSHQENFGIAIVEAMACSKAVIISDKVNIYKEIADGGGGIVNTDTLRGTIKSLRTWVDLTEVEKKNMCNRARKVYSSSFTIEKAASRLLNAIS